MAYRLKRRGCPPTRIPIYTGHTYECPEEALELYTLGDGTKCCREQPKGRKTKKLTKKQGNGIEKEIVRPKQDIAYKEKPTLMGIIEKPDDPSKIRNPRTGRWVNKTGKIGKEILTGYYQ